MGSSFRSFSYPSYQQQILVFRVQIRRMIPVLITVPATKQRAFALVKLAGEVWIAQDFNVIIYGKTVKKELWLPRVLDVLAMLDGLDQIAIWYALALHLAASWIR